jgi:peptidyl-prolyl cis-trans isomerase D
MLRILRQSQRWIMALVITIVGGVFVFFVGGGGRIAPAGEDALIDVDGQRFGTAEFERVRAVLETNLKQSVGEGVDAKALAGFSEQQTTSFLVNQALLVREGEKLGIHVSAEEMRDAVKRSGLGRDEKGAFSVNAYRDQVQYNFGSERLFLDVLRRDLMAQKTRDALASSAAVSDSEARESLRLQRESVKLAYVALDTKTPRTPASVTDADVDALLGSNEARVRGAYDEQSARFHLPEQVRARHILIRVARDATPEQSADAEKRATAALERIQKGEDFAEVAKSVSEDPGSKDRGGDLGFFRRGAMVPAFEEAAFALEPGAVSTLVKTDFGLHVIRVEEKKPAEDRTFEDAKREIARELLQTDTAAVEARKIADALAAAVKDGSTLEDAARKEGLTLERTDWLQRRAEGFVPGLGTSKALLDTAFAIAGETPSSPTVFDVPGKLVLIQVLEHRQPTADELAQDVAAERDRLLRDEQQRIEQAFVDAERERLTASGRLKIEPALISGRRR